MRVTITKLPNGEYTVNIKRTRRAEAKVPAAKAVTKDALEPTIAKMVQDCRAGSPTTPPG